MGNCANQKEKTPKVDIDKDVKRFANLHSWYKHEELERTSVFYPVLMQGLQRGHPIQVDGKEGSDLHFHFYQSIDELRESKLVDDKILNICQQHPVKISCFLSQFANVGLSLRCTKESKEYALGVNMFVKGEKQFREFESDEYGMPKLKGIDRLRDFDDILKLNSEYYQQKQAREIIEKKLETYRIPPDIFDFAQQYYPDIYDKIKKFQFDDEYNVNSELKELIEPIVKREYEIQVNEAKNACRDIFNKLYSS